MHACGVRLHLRQVRVLAMAVDTPSELVVEEIAGHAGVGGERLLERGSRCGGSPGCSDLRDLEAFVVADVRFAAVGGVVRTPSQRPVEVLGCAVGFVDV